MRKQNKLIRNEKGSITIFVVLAVMFLIFVLIGVYANYSNKFSAQLKELAEIEGNYDKYGSEEELDKLYADLAETDELPVGDATFIIGTELNAKMKILAGQANATTSTADTSITAFKKAKSLKADLTDENIVSGETSEEPIHMWYEEGIIYYYSEANTLYFAENCSQTFSNMTVLNDISGLDNINTERVTNMSTMFRNCVKLNDLSPIKLWKTSNVTNMQFMFGAQNAYIDQTNGIGMQLVDLTPLSLWDVSSVTTMNQMFKGNINLKKLEGLEDWDVANVTNMGQMFEKNYSLEDVSAIDSWNINASGNFTDIFSYVESSVRPNWNGTWKYQTSTNSTFVPN